MNSQALSLQWLRDLSPEVLRGKKFCSGDISALYTNLGIQACISSLVSFAEEHLDVLNLRGLELVDVHECLDLVLESSFFTYNGRLYKQLRGLFMGCAPSPIAAVVRVFTFERATLYTDVTYLPILYGRYIDDACTICTTREEAVEFFVKIGDQDPDRLIKWEVDFPEGDDYVPFLGTNIRVTESGEVQSRFYRKEARKNITLHANSHHPLSTKIQTVRNFYATAKLSASDCQQEEASLRIVDTLLIDNGYQNPRQFAEQQSCRLYQGQKQQVEDCVILKLPYISESFSLSIQKFISSRSLPIKTVFTPGTKLRNIFCSSRPLDNGAGYCGGRSCKICPRLEGERNCQVTAPVYRITCNICTEIYIGETGRTAKDRFGEHLRYATSPTLKSYTEMAFAVHYRQYHNNTVPDLMFEIITTETRILYRKIIEAYYINREKPAINLKEELTDLSRFLIS